ncbi:LamG domain-containing protein [Glycomyces sp. NPDC046736]|uniref:LamG domain-containing protein n=1 Tax=Glycomyces sp. NPDC046736 TaxID=3155615 RepID=UPI0033F9B4F5
MRSLVFGLASVLVGATLYAPAATAQEPDDESGAACAIPDAGLQERGETDALDLAFECDAEVLIREAQDYTSRSFAQPDGSVRSEFSAVPAWVPDRSGEWIDADASVEVDTDGSLKAAATVSELEFGGEGETAFVTATNAAGERVSLNWVEPLPEPVVDGTTVTYPEVLPEVDLEVYSGVAEFSYALVVKTPEAATHPDLESVELGMEIDGLTVDHDPESDTAVLTDASGEVAFGVAQPRMWDSTVPEDDEPVQEAPMSLEIDADSLTVVPDQDMLADPETQFPVYIDPQFSDATAATAEVFSQRNGIACGTANELCVGAQLWEPDNALGYWRSSLRFDGLTALANRDIQEATVRITQLHTGGAGGAKQAVRLYSMDYFATSGSVSWSTFTGKLVSLVATASIPTSNTDADESDQRIAWEDTRTATRVQSLVNAGGNTATFGIMSGSNATQEANKNYFRKLSASSATLTVIHGPLKPTGMTIDGVNCSTSAPGPTINTLTPKLKAKSPSALASDNRISFYLYERNVAHPNHKQQIDFNDVAKNATLTGVVGEGKLVRGKTYRWNARAWDSDGTSSRHGVFTNYCYFTVNSLPNTPTNLSTEGQGCGTKAAPTVVTSRTPKLSSVPSDPDGGTVWAKYRFYAETGDNTKEWSVKTTSGTVATTTVATGQVTADGLYRWRVITDDAFTSSAEWSPYCWIRVDTTAPEPPDVVQVTESPLPGQPVAFELVGGSDVKSFEYSLDNGPKSTVSAMTGMAGISVTPSTSSIDHSLQVWARDFPVGATGNVSSPTTLLFTVIEAQPAKAVGTWRFDGDLLDDAGENALTPETASVFGVDSEGRTEATAVFDGTIEGCLAADGPLVNTADSFTIGGWALVDQAPTDEIAMFDITGQSRNNFKVVLFSSGRWGIRTSSTDSSESVESFALAPQTSTRYGSWTHIAAVYDAPAQRLRLYVDGQLEASKAVTYTAWEATGLFSVGCAMYKSGTSYSPFAGSIDEAVVFQQALTGEQISDLMTGQGLPSALQAWYPLRGNGLDYSGRATELTGLPAVPEWVEDQHGRESSALALDRSFCPASGSVPVRTDDSFAVSAWVWLDPDGPQEHSRIFEFGGSQYFAATAKYNPNVAGWGFGLTGADDPAASWASNTLPDSGQLGIWTHVTLVVDRAEDYVSLYVDGEFAIGRGLGSITPWRADKLMIGCGETVNETGTDQYLDGAISDVRVWRGALDADEVASTHTERLAAWELGEETAGADEWGSNNLTITGTLGTDYSWEIDRYNSCYAVYGLALGGASWAETAGPVVTTDESFTITSWVRIDDLDDFRAVVSQTGGGGYGGFKLAYNPAYGNFQFSMPQHDGEGTKWTRAVGTTPPVAEKWYHLAGQVDLGAGVIRLFIDGELQSEAPIVDAPWQATGPLTIGAAEQFGEMTNFFVGGIDQVQAWGGVLDRLAIEKLAQDAPKFELDPNDADCEGEGEPPVDP